MPNMTFRIEGQFITNMAREHLYQSKDLKKAMDLLMSCTTTDEISEGEHIKLCVDILEGRKEIRGVYPDENYSVYDTEPTEKTPGILAVFDGLRTENEKLKRQVYAYEQKIGFIGEDLKDYQIADLNQHWHEDVYDPSDPVDELNQPWLFPDHYSTKLPPGDEPALWSALRSVDMMDGRVSDDDVAARVAAKNKAVLDRVNAPASALLDDYITAQRVNKGDDYGWLSPTGEFHPVEWGEHQGWAGDYMLAHPEQFNLPDDKWESHSAVMDMRVDMTAGDELAKKGWILLHSTHHGIAEVTRDESRRITKAQREFLYDYYADRGLDKIAAEYLSD